MRVLQPRTGPEWSRDQSRRLRRLEQNLGGLVVDSPYPSFARPDPLLTPVGGRIFDTTLGKPLWCNGTEWVDATGTPA